MMAVGAAESFFSVGSFYTVLVGQGAALMFHFWVGELCVDSGFAGDLDVDCSVVVCCLIIAALCRFFLYVLSYGFI